MNKSNGLLTTVVAILLLLAIYTTWYGLCILVGVWTWNTLMAGVFGLPSLKFIHGVCAAILIGLVGGVLKVVKGK